MVQRLHGSQPVDFTVSTATSPKMPAAFQLLNRKPTKSVPQERPIQEIEPLPIVGSKPNRPLHRRVLSRSCENFGIAFSSTAEARKVKQTHMREASHDKDLADVLDLYHEREEDDSDHEDLRLEQLSISSKKGSDIMVEHSPESHFAPDLHPIHFDDTEPNLVEGTERHFHPAIIPPTSKDTPRDQYGFRCATQQITQEVYDAWYTTYEPAQTRRRKKWDVLLAESGLAPVNNGLPIHFPSRSTKVQRYVRKGIPPAYRGHAWFFYANGPRILRQHPGLYDELVQSKRPADDTNVELIERDLHRTFPDNDKYKPPGYVKPTQASGDANLDANEPALISSLRRVLQAYAMHRPQVGYCQSLNFLAGMFLLFLDEEKSFWMLVVVTTDYLPHVHDANLEGANIDQAVLMLSIRESLPVIWSRMMGDMEPGQGPQNAPSVSEIVTKLPPITLVTAAWFMSVFTGVLPIETTLRVWDCFFYEGSKILFRIALTILKLGEAKILATKEFIEIFQIVQSLPRDMLDPSILIEACFKRRNGFGHLSQKDVEQRREKVSRLRQKNMTNRESKDDIKLIGTRQGTSRSVFRR